MIQRSKETLPLLYEADETAWLEAMSDLIARGEYDELDFPHLGEYLADMARRDRREVKSRLTRWIAHLLKWTHQPQRRSGSWRATMIEQRQELSGLLERGVLRNHAEAVLAEAYADGIEQAAAETGLSAETFPGECPYTLDELLSPDVLTEDATE